jgi:hypothetical protein
MTGQATKDWKVWFKFGPGDLLPEDIVQMECSGEEGKGGGCGAGKRGLVSKSCKDEGMLAHHAVVSGEEQKAGQLHWIPKVGL